MTNKENTTVVRRVFAACRQKQKAVAAAPADNAIADNMSTELRHDPAGNLDLLAIVAATGPAMTPVQTPAVAAVPKRRRLEVAEAPPPAIVTPCRAQKKCKGCNHADLLELNVMPPGTHQALLEACYVSGERNLRRVSQEHSAHSSGDAQSINVLL